MWRASSLPIILNASLRAGIVVRWYMLWNSVAAATSPIRNDANRIGNWNFVMPFLKPFQ